MVNPQLRKSTAKFMVAQLLCYVFCEQNQGLMAPLTRECAAHRKGKNGKRPKEEKFKWTDEMQDVFEKTKALIAVDTMSAYPHHNKKSTIYT